MKHKLTFVKISNQHEFAGVGFAGNIMIVLNALTHISNEDILYVDMETNTCCCTESDYEFFGTKNCWEYYFEQTPNENIEKQLNSLLSANIYYGDRNFFMSPEKFIELKNKFYKNFKLKKNVEETIDKFYSENIRGKKTLGVQIRLTDMINHHNVSGLGEYIKKIKEILYQFPDIQQVFLATDDSEVIEEVKKEIDIKTVYYENMYRANKNNPHLNPYDRYNNLRKNHRYLVGMECCQEIFTLSKCDYMLKADVSAISIVACVLSENLKKIFRV